MNRDWVRLLGEVAAESWEEFELPPEYCNLSQEQQKETAALLFSWQNTFRAYLSSLIKTYYDTYGEPELSDQIGDVREAYAFYEQESKNPSVLVNKTGLFHRVSRADYNDAANKFQTLILYYGRCAQLLEAMSEPGYTGTSPALEELTRLQSIAKENIGGESAWTRYRKPRRKNASVYLGEVLLTNEEFEINSHSDIYRRLQQNGFIHENQWISTPFAYDAWKPFALFIEYSYDRYRESSVNNMPRQVVRSLIYQIIKSMPAYSYEFKYMDYTEGGNLLDDIHSIASVRNPNAYWLHDLFQHQYNMMTSATQISDIHALLSALSVYVDNVNEILAGAMTVPEYNWNKFNEDGSLASETGNGIIPQQIVIIDHFHGIWNEEDYRSIRKMILNAYQCGISLIMVSSRPVTSNLPAGQERAKEELLDDLEKKLLLDSDIMKMSAMGLDHLRWDLKGAFFSYRDTDVANGGSINRNFLPYQDSAEHRTFIAGIAKQFEDRIEVNAGFSDVVDRQNDWASKSADVEIEIPLGLNERGKQRWMSIGGPDAAHVMMAGSTGCGKSSYLHSIINTVLVNYSPDEVEIWLADYKSNEFMRYMTNTPANITFVSTNRTAEFSYAFIDRITAEYQRRSMEFGNLTSLKEYRAENPDKHMPHLLIIIDEFHVMANHCKEEIAYRDKLTGILREARAYGITLFLADQTCGIGLSGLAEDAKKQLTGRLAMRTTYDEYNAVFEITNAKEVIAGGAEKFEVIAQISTKEGKYYEKFHTIYTPPADRDAIARESIERYGTSENPTFILGDYRYHIDWSTIDRDRRPVRDRRRMGIPLYLGKPTNLQNYFRIELEDDYDQNLMFVGANDVLQGELILHTIESVRHQGDPYRIYVIAKENARLYIALEDALRQLSKEDRHINICTGPKSISSALNTLQNEIDDRQTQREFRDHIFVIWIGLDRLYREFERLPERPESDMNQNQTSRRTQAERNELQDMFVSFFGSDVPEQEEIDASAKKDVLPSEGDRYNENPVISSIINDGSAMGVLSIVSYSRASLIRKTKCAKLGSFSHRVALRMSKDDAMEFLESSRAILSSDGNIIDEKLAVYYNGMDTIRFGPYISRWEEQLD